MRPGPAAIEMTGRRFGMLTVLGRAERTTRMNGAHWLVQCACGAQRVVVGWSLRSGNTTSCGCRRRLAWRKHGMTGSPEFESWRHMKSRCTNPNNKSYRHYGGRGIKVCAEWLHDFAAFFAHIGPRPSPEHSVDRIDNDGDYAPGNVRWATWSEQRRNQRSQTKQRPDPDARKRRDPAATQGG